MKPSPGREPAFGSKRADAIVERDPLTRFSDPASVLVSRPGESLQDTIDRVRAELLVLRRLLPDGVCTWVTLPTELRREVA